MIVTPAYDQPNYNLLGLMAAHLPAGGDHVATLPDVNGTWHCDDGGLYFVRQIGPDVLWYGESQTHNPFFANVAHGHLEGDGRLRMMWADVPKGSTGACGALLIQVRSTQEMVAVTRSGGFGGRRWTR